MADILAYRQRLHIFLVEQRIGKKLQPRKVHKKAGPSGIDKINNAKMRPEIKTLAKVVAAPHRASSTLVSLILPQKYQISYIHYCNE